MKLPPTKYLIAGGIGLIVVILIAVVFSRGGSAASPDSGDVIMITDSSDAQSELSTPSPSDAYDNPPASEAVPSPAPPPEATEAAAPTTETPQPPAEASPSSVKASSSSKGASAKASSTPSGKTSTVEITVQKGDNLTQIAKIFHTSRTSIQKENNLQSENIRSGQKLVIPVKAVKSHTVQKGENLSKLARTYRSSVEAIRRANGLSDKDEIKVGQKLKIPVLE